MTIIIDMFQIVEKEDNMYLSHPVILQKGWKVFSLTYTVKTILRFGNFLKKFNFSKNKTVCFNFWSNHTNSLLFKGTVDVISSDS